MPTGGPDGNELAVIDRSNDKWRLQYPIGKVLLEGEGWMSDMRVSPDGKQVALFRHPPNVCTPSMIRMKAFALRR